MPGKIPEMRKWQVVTLLEQGLKVSEIQQRLGLTYGQVSRIIKQNGESVYRIRQRLKNEVEK